MKITTERLILRPMTMADVNDVFEYSKNINVGPNAGWKPHESIEESTLIMESIFVGKDGIFGIELRESGKLIGSVGLVNDAKRENENVRMVGYSIGEEYWGNGYMTEAVKALIIYGFEEMKLDMISAYCYPHNQRSKRVLSKCGFVYEATLRNCDMLYDGRILDNECFVLDRSMQGFSTPPNHVEFLAKRLFGNVGQIMDGSIAYLNNNGGGPIEKHTHEHNHLFMVVEGEARVELGDKTVILHKNDAFLVEGKIPHSIWNNTDRTTIMVGISCK